MNDLNSITARAKRAKLLELENDQLRAEVEKLQAECKAYRQLVAQCQEDETNRRALEQAKRRGAEPMRKPFERGKVVPPPEFDPPPPPPPQPTGSLRVPLTREGERQ